MESVPVKSAPEERNIVALHNIYFSLGEMGILNGINLDIKAGEVHAVVGEHGSGKSSIGNLLNGKILPDLGEVVFKGKVRQKHSPFNAKKNRIATVTQHTFLCDHLSVAKNIYMNHLSFHQSPFYNRKKIQENIRRFLRENNIGLDIDRPCSKLMQSEKVFVDILRQLFTEPDLLIIDEALEKLNGKDLDLVLGIINKLRSRGMAVFYITHRIDDVYRFADRVSVLRNGELLITENVTQIDKFNLIKLAYTRYVEGADKGISGKEFYTLLKYNEAILESLPVNLLVADNTGEVKLINPKAAAYFGIDDPGKHDTDRSGLLSLEMLFEGNTLLYEKLTQSIASEKEVNLYSELMNTNETRRIINIALIPIRDGAWKIGDIIMIDDVTEQAKLREQSLLSEKLASIGILAAGFAHEIDNPLEIIKNNIEYLSNCFDMDERSSVMREIDEEIDTIASIVSNLTAMAEPGRPIQLVLCLSDIVQSVIKLARPYALKNSSRLVLDAGEELYIRADKTALRQILLNLLKNSFEAIPGDDGMVAVSLKKEEETACLKIRDNGKGLETANSEDIFLPFYSTKSSKGGNMGLGLYMTWQLVKENSGTIEVANNPDGGCCFTLNFPLVEAE